MQSVQRPVLHSTAPRAAVTIDVQRPVMQESMTTAPRAVVMAFPSGLVQRPVLTL